MSTSEPTSVGPLWNSSGGFVQSMQKLTLPAFAIEGGGAIEPDGRATALELTTKAASRAAPTTITERRGSPSISLMSSAPSSCECEASNLALLIFWRVVYITTPAVECNPERRERR